MMMIRITLRIVHGTLTVNRHLHLTLLAVRIAPDDLFSHHLHLCHRHYHLASVAIMTDLDDVFGMTVDPDHLTCVAMPTKLEDVDRVLIRLANQQGWGSQPRSSQHNGHVTSNNNRYLKGDGILRYN